MQMVYETGSSRPRPSFALAACSNLPVRSPNRIHNLPF